MHKHVKKRSVINKIPSVPPIAVRTFEPQPASGLPKEGSAPCAIFPTEPKEGIIVYTSLPTEPKGHIGVYTSLPTEPKEDIVVYTSLPTEPKEDIVVYTSLPTEPKWKHCTLCYSTISRLNIGE